MNILHIYKVADEDNAVAVTYFKSERTGRKGEWGKLFVIESPRIRREDSFQHFFPFLMDSIMLKVP